MPPVTIKSPDWTDGLWLSQCVLTLVIISGILMVPRPWSLLSLILLGILYVNHRTISANRSGAVRLNQQGQWFWLMDEDMSRCVLRDYWHIAGMLWIKLESERGQHHCLMLKRRIGARSYAQLIMAVNKDEQQTE